MPRWFNLGSLLDKVRYSLNNNKVVYGHATPVSIEGQAYVGETLTAKGPAGEKIEYIWKRYYADGALETIGTVLGTSQRMQPQESLS